MVFAYSWCVFAVFLKNMYRLRTVFQNSEFGLGNKPVFEDDFQGTYTENVHRRRFRVSRFGLCRGNGGFRIQLLRFWCVFMQLTWVWWIILCIWALYVCKQGVFFLSRLVV